MGREILDQISRGALRLAVALLDLTSHGQPILRTIAGVGLAQSVFAQRSRSLEVPVPPGKAASTAQNPSSRIVKIPMSTLDAGVVVSGWLAAIVR